MTFWTRLYLTTCRRPSGKSRPCHRPPRARPRDPTIHTLRSRVEEIRNRVIEKIEEIARTKISLGFTDQDPGASGQYRTVAQCTVGLDDQIHHPNLIRGRFDALFLEGCGPDRRREARNISFTRRPSRANTAWGFMLSIGKWITVGARTARRRAAWIAASAAVESFQRSFVGTRGYLGDGRRSGPLERGSSASCLAFLGAGSPRDRVRNGVASNWFESAKKLGDDTLAAWPGSGALWGALAESEMSRVTDTLAGALKQPCSVVAQDRSAPGVCHHGGPNRRRRRQGIRRLSRSGHAVVAPTRPTFCIASTGALRAALASLSLRPDNEQRRGRRFAEDGAESTPVTQGFERLGQYGTAVCRQITLRTTARSSAA